MKNDCIALWDRLILVLDKNGRRSEFMSRVEDIKKKSYILSAPKRLIGEANLSKGDFVEVCYNKRDAAYTFKASITDLFIGESTSAEIKKTGKTIRVQRREYVRLDIDGDMSFRVLEVPGEHSGGLSPEYDGMLLNISAGGVLFETEKKLASGSLLILNFSLKEHHSLKNVLAVIKRAEKSEEKMYLIGAEFVTENNRRKYGLEKLGEFLPPGTGTFNENLQKLVVQFIYEQQVELRQKGFLSDE